MHPTTLLRRSAPACARLVRAAHQPVHQSVHLARSAPRRAPLTSSFARARTVTSLLGQQHSPVLPASYSCTRSFSSAASASAASSTTSDAASDVEMASAAQPLFSVPIAQQGTVVATQPAPKVYLLTFTSPPDNRLTPAFNAALLTALDVLEAKFPRGVVVTTSGIPKFYSNGLDLDLVGKTENFFAGHMYPLWRRFVTYPMPTVALLNGHAFAGGLITAMMHDYRMMNPHKGYVCMNEIDFGMPLAPPMSSIFRQKLRADAYRSLVLEGKRFNALAALKDGLVDGLGGWPETIKYIEEMQLTKKAESGVYGRLKEEMWRETIAFLDRGGAAEAEDLSFRMGITTQLAEGSAKRVEEFQKSFKSRL